MSYRGTRRRREYIAKNYVAREHWLSHPGVRVYIGPRPPARCARLVDEVWVAPTRAGRHKVRCVNDAVRRAPGHGAPVCAGPCRAPIEAEKLKVMEMVARMQTLPAKEAVERAFAAMRERGWHCNGVTHLPPHFIGVRIDHDPGDEDRS